MNKPNLDFLDERRDERCLSDLTLDRLIAGELQRTGELGAHLDECESCMLRYEALQRDKADFEKEIWVAGEAARTRRMTRAAGIPAAFAAAAAAVMALFFILPVPHDNRTKGSDLLEIYARQTTGEIDTVFPGDALRPGTAIRFRLKPAQTSHIYVVGMDATGSVSLYFPIEGAAPLVTGGDSFTTEGSIVLDDAPGSERVVAFFCPGKIDTAALLDAARRSLAAANHDPVRTGQVNHADCRQSSLLFSKEMH